MSGVAVLKKQFEDMGMLVGASAIKSYKNRHRYACDEEIFIHFFLNSHTTDFSVRRIEIVLSYIGIDWVDKLVTKYVYKIKDKVVPYIDDKVSTDDMEDVLKYFAWNGFSDFKGLSKLSIRDIDDFIEDLCSADELRREKELSHAVCIPLWVAVGFFVWNDVPSVSDAIRHFKPTYSENIFGELIMKG